MMINAVRSVLWLLAVLFLIAFGCGQNSGGSGDGDNDIAVSTSMDDGITWSAPVALNRRSNSDVGDDGTPQLATDGLGTWLTVWDTSAIKDEYRRSFDILVARSTNDGVTWAGHDELNRNASNDKRMDAWPDLATDGQGTWVATWISDDGLGISLGRDLDILVARSTDAGRNWTKPAPLNSNAADDTEDDWRPSVTTDGEGTWIAAWYSHDSVYGTLGTDADILFARSTNDGATWTATGALNTNAAIDEGDDKWPQIATDGQGNWVAVWRSDDSLGGTLGTRVKVLVSHSTDDGVTWSDPAPLNTNAATSGGNHSSPTVATDGLGNWIAAWHAVDPLTDGFGIGVANLGDLDGDGVDDVAVGAASDDDGGPDRGAVWILFLNANGTVKSHQKISDTQGGFTGSLSQGDQFGFHLTSIGDHDGDGVVDLAVGAHGDDDGGSSRGAVWILFLNTDGTVKSHQKISDTDGGFTGVLDDFDEFGLGMIWLDDLDEDGVGDLGVSARFDDDGGEDVGALWILFLNLNGTVKSHQKISALEGGFTGVLSDGDTFGQFGALLEDLDGDDVNDLVVGAKRDDDGGANRGAVWILFMNTNGTVKASQKISDTEGGFTGALDDFDFFGMAPSSLGDLDGDGVVDVAIGARDDDDGGVNHGAVWILFLNADGTVKAHQKISDTEGGFTGNLDDFESFSRTASLGDIDDDGVVDLAVGGRAGVWILNLDTDGTVKSNQKIDATNGGFTGPLADDLGTDADILSARSTDDGATWTQPAPLNTNAGSDSGHDWAIQVHSGGSGTWIAVWNSEDSLGDTIGTDLDILVARSTDDGVTWSAPAPLNTDAGDYFGEEDRYPQVATDGLGKWVVVWQYDDP